MAEEPSQTPITLETAVADLFHYAIDREDVKWLLARLHPEATVKAATVEYELQLLKIVSVGWCIAYSLEQSPHKAALLEGYWQQVRDYAHELSHTTGLVLGHDIDYFETLKARLDHALELYDRELASRIIATGGHGLGAKFSEGEVSRQYLSEHGVPAEFITVESTGQSTMQSVAVVGEIMDRMQLRSCIVVSDDYHMHRAKKMLEDLGLTVYGSPREAAPSDEWTRRKRFLRESLSYLIWRIGIRV